MKLDRRVVAGTVAVALALGLLAHRPGTGETLQGAGGDESVTATSDASMSALDPAHARTGRELFVLGAPAGAAPGDAYPVQVRIDREAAKRASVPGGALEVALPDGTRYPVTFERTELAQGGNWTWIGRVDSHLGKLAAVITFGADSVFGAIPAPDGRLFQLQTNHGKTFLQPDPGLVPPGADPSALPADFVVPPARGSGPVARAHPRGQVGSAGTPAWSGMVASALATPSIVKVLAVYTTNLVQLRGSVDAARTEFVNLLEISNQAHIDSGTTARFEIAGWVETDYPPAAFNDAALYDLQANTLPDGVDIHAARDAHGADLVTMLRPYADNDFSCGIAFLSGAGLNGTAAYADYGFGVNACGAYTMAHELGHNLGSHHDRETVSGDGALSYGAFEFSFGYRQSTPTNFATVMAYTESGQPRIGFFSAPGTTACLGGPCGIAEMSDNVRSINLMAETISRFRDPPGTISVLDARVVEPNTGEVALAFPVRLATPAPVGGVSFDIATVPGGTATSNADFLDESVIGQVIPEGARDWIFYVDVLSDRLVEGDETISVQLSNISGSSPFDVTASGVIVDDDPRPTLSGSLVFPDGESGPASMFLYVDTSLGGIRDWQAVEVVAPGYHFEVEVMRGAHVTLSAYFEDDDPWLDAVVQVGTVEASIEQAITVQRAARLTGQVLVPPGGPTIDAPVRIIAWNLVGDGYGYWGEANPPNYTYSFKARAGTSVGIDVFDPPAPYVRQRVEVYASGDTVQDVTLSTLPSISIAHVVLDEGPAGESKVLNLLVALSNPAPEGGISFNLGTRDGTATGATDYVAWTRALTITQNGATAWVTVEILGDDLPEQDEQFELVATNIQGAHMPVPGSIRILDDDDRAAPNDFDADGQSGLVWRHAGTGRAALWDGAQYANARNLASVRDMAWQVAGTGDFDADGEADLLWRHGGHGRNTIWRSGDHLAQIGVGTLDDMEWELAGVGDFDGDLRSDILWRHQGTGGNLAWRGGDWMSVLPVARLADTEWQVAGIGDFDGDGHSDILWRHVRVGANLIWLKGDYRTQQRMRGVTDTNWIVAGIGDFDGDGRDDVLWTHQVVGSSVVWHAADYADQRSLVRVTNRDWRIVAVGDYDGDGTADVAWRNGATGANAVWLGGQYGNQLAVTGVRDTAWQILH